LATYEAGAFERQHHLVDGRRGDAEAALDVGFGGGLVLTRVYASMKARYWPWVGVKRGLGPPDI